MVKRVVLVESNPSQTKMNVNNSITQMFRMRWHCSQGSASKTRV